MKDYMFHTTRFCINKMYPLYRQNIEFEDNPLSGKICTEVNILKRNGCNQNQRHCYYVKVMEQHHKLNKQEAPVPNPTN